MWRRLDDRRIAPNAPTGRPPSPASGSAAEPGSGGCKRRWLREVERDSAARPRRRCATIIRIGRPVHAPGLLHRARCGIRCSVPVGASVNTMASASQRRAFLARRPRPARGRAGPSRRSSASGIGHILPRRAAMRPPKLVAHDVRRRSDRVREGRPWRQRLRLACTASRTSRTAVPTAATVARAARSCSRSRAASTTCPGSRTIRISGRPNGVAGRSAKRRRRHRQGPGRAGARRHGRLRRGRARSPTWWGRAPGRSSRGAVAAGAATPRSPARGTASRAPSEPGEAGEERRLRVELRTVADVGLVGLPERRQVHAAVAAVRPRSRRSRTTPSRR